MDIKNVLVLCTGNSCRSQMAEGYIRHFAGNKVKVYSAGIETHGLNAAAVETMADDGVDISTHTSNNVNEYRTIRFDVVITVCDHARERCPVFPSNAKLIHQNFPDPAKASGTPGQIRQAFRTTRQMIREFCEEFVKRNIYGL